MSANHHGGSVPKRLFPPSTSFAAVALIAAALLFNALPDSAQSQINGRVTSPPNLSGKSQPAQSATMPHAPVQVALPAPPPMRIVPGLDEPLVATGPVNDQENKDLDAALVAFHDAPAKAGPGGDYDDYARPLLAFIAAHPSSNWNAALDTDIGLGYYRAGYYSRTFAYLDKAWKLGRNATTPQARLLIDRAAGELARMHARVGQASELEALFADIGKRPIGGPATELVQGAHEALWSFKNDPGFAYLCGPRALRNVLVALKGSPKQIKVADDARSGPHGFSLEQMAALAGKAKLRYALIHREAGQPIPAPSIIHWNVNHYAAVASESGGRYVVQDPTFGSGGVVVVTAKAIDAESSGYFLVPETVMAGNPKAGWRTLGAHSPEVKAVYGMGLTTNNLPGETMCVSCALNATAEPTKIPNHGMTVANAHTMVVSLNLSDTSIGYQPQKGPAAFTTLTYNQREAVQPANFTYFNVSPKWTLNWLKYIQDDPNAVNSIAPITRTDGGGGGYTFTAYGATVSEPEQWNGVQLSRIPQTGPATSYQRLMPDGSKEVYALSNGATSAPRLIFLTQIIDPAGNTATLNYDGQFRLTSVTDAMGRNTTFTYGLTAAPLLVTQITDPFGRFTQLNYDASLRLSSITDAAGITSSFTYGSGSEPNFVTQLTTPYGTSTFSDALPTLDAPAANSRALTLTDPLGLTDFLYFYANPAILPCCDPANLVPTGMPTYNNAMQYRNMFYWNRHVFALPGVITRNPDGSVKTGDFSKAVVTDWAHDTYNLNFTGMVPQSVKPPLENRTWIYYPNATQQNIDGTYNMPNYVGRVLDDGASQVSAAFYNLVFSETGVAGNKLSSVDPKGRATKYAYAANNVDLLTVQQLTTAPSTYTTIASFGNYNTQHEPQTYTDAAGQVWHYTWNAAGQIQTITDPNSGVTTYTYDPTIGPTNGQLLSIQNANLQTALTLTYDSDARIRTRTDSQGYVLTYDYDNLDRVIKITYPDNTTDLYDYNFQSGPFVGTASLEMRKHTDRLGRVTTYGYDADRRLTSVTEPTAGTGTRTTAYDYYEDGTLKDIIDANSNDTHWEIDIQSRPTSKTYQFGTSSAQTETYAYEATTSRLHSVTDALGQVKTYTYGLDDRITAITYTSTVNPTPNVTLAWDPRFPRLSSMTDGLGTTNYAYTAIGTNGALKVSSTTGPFASNDTIGLTYDALGRLAGRTIAGGNETFGYDPISRMNSHVTPLGSFTYGYLGQTDQTTSRSVTNGATTVSTAWVYDTNTNDRRLVTITNSGVTRSYTLSYLSGTTQNPYDIMKVTDTAAAGHPWATRSHAYTYDLIDRLLTGTNGTSPYVYDALDNATTFGTTAATYNGFNQIKTFGTKPYAYDNDGNLLSGDGTKTYKWDAENRLIEIDYVGSTAKSNFSYDGMGHRTVDVETAAGGGTTTMRYLWCGGTICQTRDGSDVVQRRDLHEGELNVTSGQKLIYMPDQLGSVRDVLDATTGSLVQSYDLNPYGSQNRASGSVPTDYRFAGTFLHTKSGLNLATYRSLDGATGRFINRDPIREAGGPNLFGYVGASPTNNIDTDGLNRAHYPGREIDCGGGCWIRIDSVFDDSTGVKTRHLHWGCRNGKKGECGENGDTSHGGGSWDDVPEKVKQCARENGFQGDPVPANVPKTDPPTVPVPTPPGQIPTTPIPFIPIPIGGGGDSLPPLFGGPRVPNERPIPTD